AAPRGSLGGPLRPASVALVAAVVEGAGRGVVALAAGGGPAALGVERVGPGVAVHVAGGAILERRALAAAPAPAAAGADPPRHRLLPERQHEHAHGELLLLGRRGVGPVRPHALPDRARLRQHDLLGPGER